MNFTLILYKNEGIPTWEIKKIALPGTYNAEVHGILLWQFRSHTEHKAVSCVCVCDV